MRHRNKGRKLGRHPNHQRALLRNLASALILTELEDDDADNKPKVAGRIITTLPKAKEVRPLVEHCVTLARHALVHIEAAQQFATTAERNSQQWRAWRDGEGWAQWNQAIAPVVAARRRALRMLGNKTAVKVLFDEIAPRYADRPGGYTRIMRLAKPRLGDAGIRAILEFVGQHDRVHKRATKPTFETAAAAPVAAPETHAAETTAPAEGAAPE